jgi:carbonic anhydrase
MKEHGITYREWLTGAGCLGLSMVPACSTQMIFDVGFGDIFTIRLAGNIVAEVVIDTLQ